MRLPSVALSLSVAVALLAGCGADDDGGEVRQTAAALCSRLQEWIDGVERTSKELSDRTTADPDGQARKRQFDAWGDAVLTQTEQLREDLEALDLPGPLPGLDDGVEILRETRAEIESMPEDDSESLGYRIAQVFLAMENVFAKTRTSVERLGPASGDDALTEALVDEPACRDYNDPLT